MSWFHAARTRLRLLADRRAAESRMDDEFCVGVVVFEMVTLFVSPTLPLPGGERIVHLRNYDVEVVGATLIALGALGLSRTTQFADWPSGLWVGQVALLVAYAAFMLGVCLLACVVPTRRALRVEPIVAMQVE